MILGLEFPPVSHLVNWPEFFGDDSYGVNKVVLVYALACAITMLIFILGNKKQMVPSGAQNLAEMSVEFVEDQIVLPTIGPKGLRYTPLLISFFFFIFFCNIFEIIPFIQFPANARIAVPFLLAILVWFIFNIVGIKRQGFGGYMKSSLIPPGVPKAILPLMVLIEFVSTFFVRPFSLAIRLFANMLAGHLILVTFAILSAAIFGAAGFLKVGAAFPFALLIALTAFEILVSGLQAFIFAILTAVYIGLAMHPEH